jgi:hypothetical protein
VAICFPDVDAVLHLSKFLKTILADVVVELTEEEVAVV